MKYHDLTYDELKEFPDYDGHEIIRHVTDVGSGLDAYIAVHNDNLGPSLGGCRMRVYEDRSEAIRDVLRLSRGMTYKNALARLPLGGGKSVILGDPFKEQSDALLSAMGQGVDSLEGRYITAEDSGTTENSMRAMARKTKYVVGISEKGSDVGGDPSPVTAYGVFKGIKASAKFRYGKDDLSGMTVSVQGLGAVGYTLCEWLHKSGVKIIATDVREESIARAKEGIPGIKIVSPEDIFSVKADIFSPCAMGAQINDETIPLLNVDIVCGAANNQLDEPRHEDALGSKNILYAPDYVVNAGGVIAVCYEYIDRTNSPNPFGHEITRENMLSHVDRIEGTLGEIFEIYETQNLKPGQAADKLAESIFNAQDVKRSVLK